MNVLTWNLFHGRSTPSAKRDLLDRFAELLASWEWDVALLQEVPPWWPSQLAATANADFRVALTSRNEVLWLRRWLGERWPDLVKSNAGGCNAILVRRNAILAHRLRVGAIVEDRALRLRLWPERRVGQLVRLADGTCVANVHASARVPLAEDELVHLWDRALAFADGARLILGGDLNLRSPRAPQVRDLCIAHAASRDVDHIFARGLAPTSPAQELERWASAAGRRVQLSDHVPLLVGLATAGPV